MGRQKGRHLQVAAKQLVARDPDAFSIDFRENKARLKELDLVEHSTEERNKLAGAITNEMKKLKAREKEEA